MAEVKSTFELQGGGVAPDFALSDTEKNLISLNSFLSSKTDNGLLIMFACNHCPFVLHIAKEFGNFAREIAKKNIKTIAINANDIEKYPQDSPENMRGMRKKYQWDFPYLFDESQEVAKSYSAACTPDFFLFNKNLELQYTGQFDASRPNNGVAVTGDFLKKAIEYLLAKKEMPETEIFPSSGCNIKWKTGNEPDYFQN